jgi:hypothetical protein
VTQDKISLLKAVTVKGEDLLASPIGTIEDAEYFIKAIDEYLLEVAALEEVLKSSPGKVDKGDAEKFLAVHGEIISRAELEKKGILKNLTELHRRSGVLRTYLDQGPDRVSITGKREG